MPRDRAFIDPAAAKAMKAKGEYVSLASCIRWSLSYLAKQPDLKPGPAQVAEFIRDVYEIEVSPKNVRDVKKRWDDNAERWLDDLLRG